MVNSAIILVMSETVAKKKRIRVVAKRDKRIIKPQQRMFIENYTNTKSATFGNAYRSALQAGFSDVYARQILYKPYPWLMEIDNLIQDERMLLKAESNFREVQNLDITNGGDKVDSTLLAQKIKVDTFLAERLNKAKYSTRTENLVLAKVEHTIDEETKRRLDALL